jgi:hypothetical protein
MTKRGSQVGLAVLIGAAIVGVTYFGAYCLSERGAEFPAALLSWPNSLLQSLVSCVPDTGDNTGCEGTPLNVAAYFCSFGLAWFAYAVAIYALIRRRGGNVA